MKKINYYLRLQGRLRCSDNGLPEYIKKFFKKCPFFVFGNEYVNEIIFQISKLMKKNVIGGKTL